MLGIVQLVVVIRDQLAVELAAREAARAAAVAGAPANAARVAAERATSLRPLTIDVGGTADRVTVSVSHASATDVALIGALIGDVTVTAEVTMAREPP
jgi:hypothetical protein